MTYLKKSIISIVIFAFVGTFYYFYTFYMIENNFVDRLITEKRDIDHRLVILAVDDESLNQVGRWPWPRNLLARLTESLVENGATAVFLDFVYSEPSLDRTEDEAWDGIIDKYDNIYLPAYFNLRARQDWDNRHQLQYENIQRPVMEIPTYQLGHINTLEERDNRVRNVLMGIRDEQGDMIPAISVLLANHLLPEARQITWTETNEWYMGAKQLPTNARGELSFLYAHGASEIYDVYPVVFALEGMLEPSFFEGAVVFIGPYSVGLGDRYYTPTNKSLPMYGVEIHRNIVQAFLDEAYYNPLSRSYGLILLFVLTFLSYFIIDLFRAKWSYLVFFGLVIAYIVAFNIIFVQLKVLLPLFYVILAIGIAYIASVVSQYVVELRERNRVTGLFGRYLSKGVVDEILSNDEEIKLGGVRKDITLLFVDIRGFTPLSEKMQPEEVIQILNEYLDLCTRAVFEYEGTLDKFMGDGVMSFFGAPIIQDDHAERAVRAALLMKKGAMALAQRLEEKYGHTVGFGMGINSGPAVVGNIGSHERLDYTAIGDTVNLSARLESNAKAGQILISENTYEKVKDLFNITPLEPIKVKGKEKPVMVYQVEEEIS